MTAPDTDRLAELIRCKWSCLVQIRDMGSRQLELIQTGAMSELLDLLATKQHMLVQLQQIERQLDPFRGEAADKRRWRSVQQRQECAAQCAACESLLAEIMAMEKQSEQELIRRRDEAAARLEGMHARSQARGAYLAEPRIGVGQLDLVSDT